MDPSQTKDQSIRIIMERFVPLEIYCISCTVTERVLDRIPTTSRLWTTFFSSYSNYFVWEVGIVVGWTETTLLNDHGICETNVALDLLLEPPPPSVILPREISFVHDDKTTPWGPTSISLYRRVQMTFVALHRVTVITTFTSKVRVWAPVSSEPCVRQWRVGTSRYPS